MHPRADSVVIMIAINQSGDKILLGKNVRASTEQTVVFVTYSNP